MSKRTASMTAICLSLGLLLGLVALSAEEKASNEIVTIFGVGGVLTADGVLHQYVPDAHKWLTIDEAFQRDGQEMHVLPLPVRADEVRMMESWGFLVTHSGNAWYYDLAENRWLNVGTP